MARQGGGDDKRQDQARAGKTKNWQDRKEKVIEKRKREGRMIRHWEEDLVGGILYLVGGILILCKRGVQGG